MDRLIHNPMKQKKNHKTGNCQIDGHFLYRKASLYNVRNKPSYVIIFQHNDCYCTFVMSPYTAILLSGYNTVYVYDLNFKTKVTKHGKRILI